MAPSRHRRGRKPDVTVVRIVAPVAVVIEIFVANDIVRKILRRARIIVTMIAAVGPGIKLVGLADLFDIGVQRVGSAEIATLSGMQSIGLPVAGGFSFARADVTIVLLPSSLASMR